jgi:2-oxoglutarate ferredoxin oxidoreductase subunit alpha
MDQTRGPHHDRRQPRLGLGCVYAGATVGALVPDHAIDLDDGQLQELLRQAAQVDPETGKSNFCIIQAEDELSAIGMVLGAGWNGARHSRRRAAPASR